jgi:cell division cycle 2-like protein
VPRQDGVLGVRRDGDGGSLPPSKKRKHSPGFHDTNVSKLKARDEEWSRRGPDALAAELPLHSPPPLSDTTPEAVNLEVLVVPNDAERRDGITEEEEDCATRNIFTSRWADADEEEEEVIVPKKKKKSVSPAHLPEEKSTKKVMSPELGAVMDSKTSRRTSSSSSNSMGSENCNIEVDEGNCMDVEKEDDIDSSAGCSPGTRSRSDVHRSGTPEAVRPPRRCFNMLQGCRSIDEFERINTINEGTYGVVFRVRDKKTGEIVALKKVKVDKEKGREGFPLTSLREINILLSFDHPSIVDVKEVVVGGHDDDTFMVMEYMEHDLKGVMEAMKQPYTQSEVKCLMLQLLEGVKYLHDNWVLHR